MSDSRKQAYIGVTRMCAQKLVDAIRQDVFPDEETEKMFGIVMNDEPNDGLGDLIYNCWAEIYKRRLYYGGETIHQGDEGPASREFQNDICQALTTNRLPTTFRRWAEEVVRDEQFPIKAYCTRLLSRTPSLPFDVVIHPTCEKHRSWMERFRIELGENHNHQATTTTTATGGSAAAAAGGGGAVAATTVDNFCQHCGKYGCTMRCSSCTEVYYCSKEHQKSNWRIHKTCCKAIHADPVSVWIRVEEGEGNGLQNEYENHIFKCKADGLTFARAQTLGGGGGRDASASSSFLSRPLRSPFCELMGWNVEIYCNSQINDIHVSSSSSSSGPGGGGRPQVRVNGKLYGNMNSAGVYLGSDLNDGFTRFNNMSGPIYVTGRRQNDGKPLNGTILWGVLNFIWDAMDLYDGTSDLPRQQTLLEWANDYKAGTWIPAGGDGGLPIYSTDYQRDAIDHR